MPRSFPEVGAVSAAVIAAWVGFAAWASYCAFFKGYVQIYAEDGLIENMQAYLLAAACAIYLATLALEKRSDKLILLSCALLCYGFMVRELDVETFDIPRAFVFIGSGAGRTASLAVAIAAIALYAVLADPGHYRKAAVQFLKSRAGVLLMAGGAFLVIGEILEKSRLGPQRVFFEEMAELFGYVLILLSSIAANSFLSRLTIRSSPH